MFTALQRRIVWFVWALALFGTLGFGARAETLVVPLIDRPGENLYCETVGRAIDDAEISIDALLASIDADANLLVDALVRATNRGVAVRVMVDTSDWSSDIRRKGEEAVSALRDLGLDARLDDPAVTTHAKLVVIDRETVILGSTNWNAYAFTEHEQADVLIDDPDVAAVFADAFERVWGGSQTAGDASIDLTAAAGPAILPLPDADGSVLCGRLVLELLSRATTSVHLAMYRMSVYPTYTDSLSNALVSALVAAAGRGAEVRVLLDDCRFYTESAEANLASAITLHQRGIEVRFDDPEDTMHAKLVIVDGTSVVLGSTNWNYYSLERNVEANVAFLAIPEVAAAYEALFARLWQEGRPID